MMTEVKEHFQDAVNSWWAAPWAAAGISLFAGEAKDALPAMATELSVAQGLCFAFVTCALGREAWKRVQGSSNNRKRVMAENVTASSPDIIQPPEQEL